MRGLPSHYFNKSCFLNKLRIKISFKSRRRIATTFISFDSSCVHEFASCSLNNFAIMPIALDFPVLIKNFYE